MCVRRYAACFGFLTVFESLFVTKHEMPTEGVVGITVTKELLQRQGEAAGAAAGHGRQLLPRLPTKLLKRKGLLDGEQRTLVINGTKMVTPALTDTDYAVVTTGHQPHELMVDDGYYPIHAAVCMRMRMRCTRVRM